MSESHDPVAISGYQPILEALVSDGVGFVLVAGHAVNAWAEVYYERIANAETFLPFTSKDADLIGTRDQLYRIAKTLSGTLQIYRDLRTPVLGVFTTDDSPPLKLELLQGLYGMGNPERIITRAKHFGTIPVIDPILLLVSKAANLGGLDQDGRQDEKHLQMMSLISRCYLEDLVHAVGEHISERDLINELKLMKSLLEERLPTKGLELAKLTINHCLPIEAFENCEHPKLKRFLKQSFELSA